MKDRRIREQLRSPKAPRTYDVEAITTKACAISAKYGLDAEVDLHRVSDGSMSTVVGYRVLIVDPNRSDRTVVDHPTTTVDQLAEELSRELPGAAILRLTHPIL